MWLLPQLSLFFLTAIQLTASRKPNGVLTLNNVASSGQAADIMSAVRQLTTSLSQLRTTVSALRTGVAQLRTGMSELQRDVAQMKTRMACTGKLRYHEGKSK